MEGKPNRLQAEPSLRAERADVALSAALLSAGLVEIWVLGTFEGGRVAGTLGMVLVAVPLVWRRRAPLAVCVVAAAAIGLTASASGLSEFLGVVVATFSVGVYARLRTAVLGLAAVCAAQTTAIMIGPDASVANVLYGIGIYGAAWLGGVAVRQQAVQVIGLRSLAAQLREEQSHLAEAAVVEERARIARELHDVIAHSVSVMVVQAGAAEHVLESDPARAREALRAVQETGAHAAAELRRLLGVTRGDGAGTDLAPQPGLAELPGLVEEVRRSGLAVEVLVSGLRTPLPPGMDLAAYRIVQEALTNVLKHARASAVRITVRQDVQGLHLSVTDDGAHATRRRGYGHGLVGMRERCALYGGRLDIGTGPDGFTVTAYLPPDGVAAALDPVPHVGRPSPPADLLT